MTDRRDVTAVIVTHDDVERAVRCAASLGLAPDRVIIVANVAPSKEVTPWKCLSPVMPQGYGANINLGVAGSPEASKWLLLLNDDIVFEPETLERLVTAADADPTVGAVTPALYGEDRHPQVVAFRHPTVCGEISGVVSGPDLVRRTLRRGHSVVPTGAGMTHEDWVLGAAMLVRSAAFADVVGFDERYFLYSEDTQFGLDLQRAGWRSAVLHDAWALHIGAGSTTDARWRDMLLASRRRYVRENWSRPRFAGLCAVWLVAQVWNIAYLAARGVAEPSSRTAHAAHVCAHLRHPPWR